MTDNEIEEFYRRWEARFRGPDQAHRPAVASFVRDIKTLGISHREMDFIQGLRWSLEEVSRTYGSPNRCCPTWNGPPFPTSTPPSASSGATP
jgi:phage portal protein BeeE